MAQRGAGVLLNDQSAYSARLDGNGAQPVPRPAPGALSRAQDRPRRSSFQGRAVYRRRRRAAYLHAHAHRQSHRAGRRIKMDSDAGHRRRQPHRPGRAAQRRDRYQCPRHSRPAGVGGRDRDHAGAGPQSARRGARPGRAAMAALAGAASAQQDGRHFRRRGDCRGAGAEMQGLRHARRRRQLRPARRGRIRHACARATNFYGSSASSISSCC